MNDIPAAAQPPVAIRTEPVVLGWTEWKSVLGAAAHCWLEHRDSSRGAALAFYTLFSMAPILLITIAIAGAVLGTKAAEGEIVGQLSQLIGADGAHAIQGLLAGARDPASGAIATVIAGVLLLVGATTVFAELKDSLDEIWDVKRKRYAGFLELVYSRLLSFSLVFVLGFLLLVSLVVNAGMSMLAHFWHTLWPQMAVSLAWLSAVVAFVAIAALFAVIYKMLPDVRLSWGDVTVGAIATAALFSLGKVAIGLYLGNSGVASSFGAAGSIVALLLWVYYSAQIFFLGAEFTRQFALQVGSLRG